MALAVQLLTRVIKEDGPQLTKTIYDRLRAHDPLPGVGVEHRGAARKGV